MIKNKRSQKRIYVSKNVRKACVGKNVLDKKRKSCNMFNPCQKRVEWVWLDPMQKPSSLTLAQQ